jgi:hypothetical protein
MNKIARVSVRVLIVMLFISLFVVLAQNSTENSTAINISFVLNTTSNNSITGNLIGIQPTEEDIENITIIEDNFTIDPTIDNESITENTTNEIIENFTNNITLEVNETIELLENETITNNEPELIVNQTVNTAEANLQNLILRDSSRREVNANIRIISEPGNLGTATASDNVDLEVTPARGPIKKLLLKEVDLTTESSLGLEELPKTFPSPLGRWAQVYAIDPTNLNFQEGLVTVIAKGVNLYKCKDYNFEEQDCYGNWSLFQTNLIPGQEYTFILTAEDPVFAEEVSTCTAEDSAAQGSWGGVCDAADGSLLESDDSLVETHTYQKNTYAGVRVESVNTSVTNCNTIDKVELCYEWWYTRQGENCMISVDADGGVSYTDVVNDVACTTATIDTTANPGVICTDVTALETWVCGNFFGPTGTRALGYSELDREPAGAGSTETLSIDVFYFNVSYTLTGDIIFPNLDLVNPTPTNNTLQSSTTTIINTTLIDETGSGNCTLQWNGVNESMPETVLSVTSKYCTTTKLALTDGIYNYTVYGNDTSGNTNVTELRFLTIDTISPNIDLVSPTETSGTYLTRTNILINVTANDTHLANITIDFYNSTGLFNSTISAISPHFMNFTTLDDGIYYFNATASDNVSNLNFTTTRNVTIDTTVPSVFDVRPVAKSAYDALQTIEIAANVTEVNPDTVLANLTYPNGTLNLLTLSLVTGEKYNTSFNIPALPGVYNITFIVNDSVGWINNTVTTNFTANDIFPPFVNITAPPVGSNYPQNTNITINVNVTDQTTVDTVLANITLPDLSVVQETLTDIDTDSIYNISFQSTTQTGTYTILIIANDTRNNLNNTETRTFNVQDLGAPLVNLVSPTDTTTLGNPNITFICNATDTAGLANLTLYHNLNGSFIVNQTNTVNGLSNQTNFTINNTPDGTYKWNCLAEDTSANTAFAINNYTFSIDTTPPNVTNVLPLNTTSMVLGSEIIINATVLDTFSVNTVLANITLPNGTTELITMLDGDADNLYNGTYITLLLGQHNITIFANDSVNNINDSESTLFNATLVPNITLNYPANNALLDNPIIEFNFTVNDDEATLSNCTLYSNFTGTWQVDTTIFNIINGTETNITKIVPDGTFIWNVKCMDSLRYSNFSKINFTVTVNTTFQGMFVYQQLDTQTPLYKIWNEYNITGNEYATPTVGGDITWTVLKANHERNEFILGTEDKQADVNIQIYNHKIGTWNNLQQVSTDVPNAGYRGFDVAYEDVSGDALIVYETSSGADNVFGYRTWNGTAYSAAQTFTTDLAFAAINWLSLTVEQESDNLMLLIHNDANDLYAIPWNGTHFDGSKNSTLSTATTSITEQHFAFAWEESSGDGLVVYGEGTNLVYRGYNPTTGWTGEATVSLGDSLDAVRLCSDPASDYIGIIIQDDDTGGNGVNALMWNGDSILNTLLNNPSGDGTTEPSGASNANLDCVWHNSGGVAWFGFVDSSGQSIDYFNYTIGTGWSTSALTTTGNSGNFATSTIKSLRFTDRIFSNESMITAMDIAEDISMIRWDGLTFRTISTSPLEQSSEVLNGDQEGVMFDWLSYDAAPNATNISVNDSSISSGELIDLNITVTDDNKVSVVSANVTIGGVSVELVNLTDDNSDNVYNGTITTTTNPGTHTITIIANDTSTHQNVNDSETITFTVADATNPSVFALIPISKTNYTNLTPIEISVNVTDNAFVDVVLANLTYPNGTNNVLTLTNGSEYISKYNTSFTPPSLIGTFNITFIANDTSNNINDSESTNFTLIDNAPPNVQLNAPDNASYTNLTTINFNWTTTNGIDTNLDCNLTIDGVVNVSNIPSLNGTPTNYSLSIFNDTTHDWNVTCIDDSGNDNTSATWSITVDTIFPKINYVAPTTTSENKSQTYIQATINFNDTNLDTAIIYLYNTSGLVQSNTSTTSPLFVNFTNLAEGTYYLNATVNDSVNHINSTVTRAIVLDTTSPSVNLNLANNTWQQSDEVSFQYTATDTNLANCTLYGNFNGNWLANETNTTLSSGVQSTLTTNLTNGTYLWNVFCYDGAGNKAFNNTNYTITIDSVKPTINLNIPIDNLNTTLTYFNFNWTLIDNLDLGLSCNLTINGTVNVSNIESVNNSPENYSVTGFSEGTYQWNITCVDNASNINTSLTRNFSVDNTAPNINFQNPTPTPSNYSQNYINTNITATDYGTAIDTITIYVYNFDGTLNLSNTSSTSPFYWNYGSLDDGVYHLNATANDYTNNANYTSTRTISLDTTLPTLDFASLYTESGNYSQNYIDVNISVTDANFANLTIYLYNSDGSLNQSNSSNTTPYYINYANLADGTYYTNSTSYDGAKNSNVSLTQTISLDTTLPTLDFVTLYTQSGNYSQNYIDVNISVTDANFANLTVYLYNSDGSLNQSNSSNTTPYYINYANLADGTYYTNSTSYDGAKNSNVSLTQMIILDTTVPVVSLVSPANNTLEEDTNFITFVYNVTDVTSEIINCSLYIDGVLTETESGITKNINQSFTSTLNNGEYNWTVGCYDDAQNTANSTYHNITTSTSAPTVDLNLPVNNYNSSTTSIIFNCSAIDNSALANITLNIWNSNGILNYSNITSLTGTSNSTTWIKTLKESQNYSWNCLVYDNSDLNAWGATNYTLFIDTIYPTIEYKESTETSENYLKRNNVWVNVSASDDRLANITIYLYNSTGDLKQSSTSTSSPYFVNFTGLSDGLYYFNSTTSDSAGNSNSTSTRNVTVDLTLPTVNFVTPYTSSGTYSQTNIEVNASVTDTNFANVTIYIYNSDGSLNQSNSSTSTPYYVNYTNLVDGTYYTNLTAFDLAGNIKSSSTQTIILSTGAPIASSVTSTPSTPFYNNGTLANVSVNFTSSVYPVNLTFHLYDLTGTLINTSGPTAVNNANDLPINYTLPSGYAEGNYSLNFTITDSLGNNGTSNVGAIVIDTTFPNITLVNSYTSSGNYSQNYVEFNVSAVDTYFANVTIYIYNSDGSLNQSNSSTSTPYYVNYTNLADGTYYLNSSASDLAGNINSSLTQIIVIDALPPVISTITSTPSLPLYINGSTQNISMNFTSSEYLVNLTFYLYNSAGGIANYSESVTLGSAIDLPQNYTLPSGLTEGNYSLNFTLIDTAGNSNESNVGTIVIDTSSPNVFNLVPVANSNFTLLNSVEISANVTDDTNVSVVLANVTLPNGTIEQITLTNVLGRKYNVSFETTDVGGVYNVTFIANDTFNFVNNTETTNFTIVDLAAPTITVLGCTPPNLNLDGSTQCIATITDNVAVDNVTANVTFPDGNSYSQSIENISANYFFNFTNSSVIGKFTVTWWANDTDGNVQTVNDNFNISDISKPTITLNNPINNYNSSSNSVGFNFTAIDDALTNMNCSLSINGTTNQTNPTVTNGTATIITVSGFSERSYTWDINCTDESNNSNISETRTITIDSSNPQFISLVTSPSSIDDLDPNVNVTVYANITDNKTAIDTVFLQRKLSAASDYTNLTLILNATSGIYFGTFNATDSGIYNLRLYANDTAGNNDLSNVINITVETDYTWTRVPSSFTAVSANVDTNITLGNLTINNTGDFTLTYNVTSDSNTTTFNDTTYFSLAPKEVKVILVNDSASAGGLKTVTLSITDNQTIPTTLQTTGQIIVAPGQPVIVATITTPSTETKTITQGDTGISFIATITNVGEGNATNVTISFDYPDDWTLSFGTASSFFSQFNSGDSEEINIEVDIPSNATAGSFDVVANATGINATGNDLQNYSLIFADVVNVTVSEVTTLGAVTTVTTTPSSGTTGPSGGGSTGGNSGGGGLIEAILSGETVVSSQERFDLVRGETDSFIISIKNIFEDATLKEIYLDLDGFLSQYLQVSPQKISQINYGDTGEFVVTITSPEYLELGEHDLTAYLIGELHGIENFRSYKKDFLETKKITLVVHEVSQEEANQSLDYARRAIEKLREANLSVSKLEQLLSKGENELNKNNYEQANGLAQQIIDDKDSALETLDLIDNIRTKIRASKSLSSKLTGIGKKYSETNNLILLAKAALERGDYVTALQRIKDAEFTLAIEGKEFRVLFFLIDYWWAIILGSVLFGLLFIFGHQKYQALTVTNKIKNLENEETTINNLIKETQTKHFTKQTLGSTMFQKTMKHYEDRLAKSRQQVIQLRHKRVGILHPSKLQLDLIQERETVMVQLTRLQKKYFQYGKVSKSTYERESKVYQQRLAEIESEQLTLEMKLQKKALKRPKYNKSAKNNAIKNNKLTKKEIKKLIQRGKTKSKKYIKKIILKLRKRKLLKRLKKSFKLKIRTKK